MKEAAEKKTQKTRETDDGEQFEETFRPRKNVVNFGVLKNEKAKKVKRPGKKHPAVLLLILVLLLTAVGAAAYFTGALSPVLERFGITGSAEEAQLSLEEREAQLAAKEAELNQREEGLDRREKQLKETESSLREEDGAPETAETFGEKLRSLTDEELTNLKKVSAIYAKMDPVKAAAAMGGVYDLSETSAILYYMQPAAAALVLEQMDPGRAADITNLMLGS